MASDNESGTTGASALSPTATSPDVAAASSGCPVMIKRGASASSTITNEAESGGRFWNRWFSSAPFNTSTNDNSTSLPPTGSASISECPVKGRSSLPASIEEAANHSQLPVAGQKIPLSTQRAVSSIPRGDATDSNPPTTENTTTDHTQKSNDNTTPKVPAHQPANSSHWTYPSEQQFYNAMLKKGYQPPIETIPFVLKIHNSVNERSWLQVCKWEKELHGNENPKLVKFVGRPKDLSPKAWWNSRVLMTQEPFDRHDWYVEDNEKEGAEPRRYVIDFYEGKEDTGDNVGGGLLGSAQNGNVNGAAPQAMKPPSMYIDVRPALDTPSAAVDRMTMAMREALPGITSVWDSYKMSSSANVGSAACANGNNCEASKNDGKGNV